MYLPERFPLQVILQSAVFLCYMESIFCYYFPKQKECCLLWFYHTLWLLSFNSYAFFSWDRWICFWPQCFLPCGQSYCQWPESGIGKVLHWERVRNGYSYWNHCWIFYRSFRQFGKQTRSWPGSAEVGKDIVPDFCYCLYCRHFVLLLDAFRIIRLKRN